MEKVLLIEGLNLTGGETMEGRIRKCIKYQEVYSPVLGKKVKRCMQFAEGLGLEEDLSESRRVRRRRKRKLGLEDPAKCVEWQTVYSPALGKHVKRCKRFAGEEGLFGGLGLEGIGSDALNALKLGAIAFVPIVGSQLILSKISLGPLDRVKQYLPPVIAFGLASAFEKKIGSEWANAIKVGSALVLISTLYNQYMASPIAELMGISPMYELPAPATEEEIAQLPAPEEEISAIEPAPAEEEFLGLTTAPSEEEMI
jgi:hypothetical protein